MILIGIILVLASVFVSPGGDLLASVANEYTAIEQSALILDHLEQHQLHLSNENTSSGPLFTVELEPEGEESESKDETQNTGSFFTHHKDLLKQFLKPSAYSSSSRALLFPATARIILYQVFLI